MHRSFVLTVLVAVSAFVGALPEATDAGPKFVVVKEQLPFQPIQGARAMWGVHAGAGYRIEVPKNWNGDLVLYAHGYNGEGPELTVFDPPIRSHLISKGFAWAASSYRANGYVPGTGAQDTHRLLRLFGSLVGQPHRVYLTGTSMGGHVTAVAIEQWPNSFDGAQPECGVMGDNELFDFFQDAYLVAETVVGNVPEVPTPADYFTSPDGWAATRAALGTSFPTGLTAAGQRFKAIVEQLTGGDRPTFDTGFAGPNGGAFIFNVGAATTGPGRENAGTVYQFDNDPAISAEEAAFNERIVRIAADPQYRHPDGLGRLPGTAVVSPAISGDISIPVLSTHTIGELFVPFHMEQIYARRVASHGKSDLLVSRAIRDIFHCSFSEKERIDAFDDLVTWVEDGVRPAGDDILRRAAVANPEFGCQFTEPDRSFLPRCPA
jgi:pimeloyl-ACP methyl ester carboxylesterase